MENYDAVKLIAEVKKRTPLWSGEPIDRVERLDLWKEVCAIMYPDYDRLTKAEIYDRVVHVQKKWRSLRDAYNREIRWRIKGIRKSKKAYRHFKKLSFLGNLNGAGSDGGEEEQEEDNSNHGAEEHQTEESTTADPLTVRKKMKRERRRSFKPPSSDANEPDGTFECPVYFDTSETESDGDKLFLLSFLPEMKQLPVNIKMWVRTQIANVMQEAVANHYNNTMPETSSTKRPRDDSSE